MPVPWVIQRKNVWNAYFDGGPTPVGRKYATKYKTQREAEEALPIAADILRVEQAELEALKLTSSGKHHPGQPSYGRRRSGSPAAKSDVREDRSSQPISINQEWDDDPLSDYIRRAQAHVESGRLDREEMEYKREIISSLGEARVAVRSRDGTWPTLVRKAFPQTGSPIQWQARDTLVKWFDAEPKRAGDALEALWIDGDVAPADRIRGFIASLPDGVLPSGKGTRLRVVAALLMALGPEYPPYAVRKFDAAYDATGYDRPPEEADEAETYNHALAFLDAIVARTAWLGCDRPSDRLEAQSVVWMMQGAEPDDPALWQVRAGTDADGAPRFLELNQIDIGFQWHSDVGAVSSREEFNGLLTEEGGSADTSAHPRSAGTQLWQFAHEMAVGDLVVVPLPGRQVHIGEITGPYRFDENPSGHSHSMDVRWLAQSVPHEQIGVALGVERLQSLVPEGQNVPPERVSNAITGAFVRWTVQRLDDRVRAFLTDPDNKPSPLSLETLADELLYDVSYLRNIKRLLDEKRQVIFQGPPGTGKTYVARELARALAGADERVRLVQFHPSYAYEDFVQGYRPTLKDGQAGFELRDGPLVQAANEARNSAANHYLIIDEINRGNLAKVFGELYFLLEYRDQRMRLQYAKEEDEDFSLPENLYIIGTMNTADRSIALVDLALRRRFSFVEFHPGKAPVEGLLGRWLERKEIDLPWLARVVDLANTKLDNREAAIGPSYFMKDDLDEERVGRIWEHDVLPYIEEQLYGQHERLAEFVLDTLRGEAAGEGPDAGDDATGEQEDEPGSGDATD